MRKEFISKYYPAMPDPHPYEAVGRGAGIFFRQVVKMSPGRYRARVQILFSERACGEGIRVFLRKVGNGGELGSALLFADPSHRDRDEVFVSFEIQNMELVEFSGRSENNFATTHLRTLTILEDRDGLLDSSAFFFKELPPPSISAIKRLTIGTTGVCTASCIHCPTNKKSMPSQYGHMSMSLFSKIVDNLARGDFSGQLCLGLFGEPLSDPFLVERLKLIRRTFSQGRVAIATNAGFFDESKHDEIVDLVDHIGVHIETLTEEIYNSLMSPLKLSRVLPRAMKLIEKSHSRGRYNVRISVPTHKGNISDTQQIARFFEDKGVPVDFASLCSRSWDDGPFRELSLAPLAFSCRPKKLTDTMFIDWDGQVLPCCFDFSKSMPLGDLNRQTIEEVYLSDEWQAMMERFRRMEWAKNGACARCRTDNPKHVSDMVAAMSGNDEYSVKELDVRLFKKAVTAKRGSSGLIISDTTTADGAVVYGPYIKIPYGNYRIYVNLNVISCVGDSYINLNVCSGGKEILSQRRLKLLNEGKTRAEMDFIHAKDALLEFRINKNGLVQFEYLGAILVRL